MGVFDKINKVKRRFQEVREDRRQQGMKDREEKVAQLNNERLKVQAEKQSKNELASEKKMLFDARTQGARDVLAKVGSVGSQFKSQGGSGFGSQVRARFGSQAKNGAENIFTASSNKPNNIYTQSSGKNPFTMGSGNNPYNFSKSSALPKKKRQGKSITIRL